MFTASADSVDPKRVSICVQGVQSQAAHRCCRQEPHLRARPLAGVPGNKLVPQGRLDQRTARRAR